MQNSDFQVTSVNPGGLTNLIRNLARDCTPSQYLREFTKNSIEACQRAPREGSLVLLDYNPEIHRETGVFKLSITDNGDGMTDQQMLNLLNNLSASGAVSNEHQNYGVGAKISAMTRNHTGILYESWKNNVGHSVLICYNEETDHYGVKGFKVAGNDTVQYALPLPDSIKPSFIGASGTRVTFLGMSADQDTMIPPQGMGNDRSGWIVSYLNNRFFTLPAGVEIQARAGYFEKEEFAFRNKLVKIQGYKARIEEFALDKGTLRLSNANAHWWILTEDKRWGETAVVNQGEVFDKLSDRSNRSMYFGIIVGRNRVVIYVEPDQAVQNTARTGLVQPNGSALNWGSWQDEFRTNIPDPIKKFMDDLMSQSVLKTNSNAIVERLVALKDFYKFSGYQSIRPEKVVEQLAEQSKVELKTEPVAVEALAETKVETEAQKALEQDAPPPTLNPNPQLDLENSEPTAPLPETGKQTDPPKDKVEDMPVAPPEATPPPQPTPPAQEDNAKVEEDKKDPDVKKDSSSDLMKIANLFPYVEWTTDEKSPQLIGRAAEFVESNNTILANQNFKGFQDLSKYFESKYGDSPEASLQIKICVAESIEQVLMECTAGILSLKDQPHWNPYQINQGLTKEALTASVMQRYWLVGQIDKELKSRIKSEENS
jgi:hypothetical protein